MEKHILIIDDDLDTALTLSERLIHVGFKTKTANDAITALDILKQGEIGLIILDIKMPFMDGISFAAIVKSKEDLKGLPIFILSVDDSKETMEACCDIGIAEYMTKPCDFKLLIKKIKKALNSESGEK